jgi:hypothetical protein
MTYYFPLGRPATIPINIAYSNLATTASSAVNSDISAATASHAGSVQNTPPNGTAGTDQNLAACGTGTVGPVGPAGPIGPKGTSISLCPAGTKDCSSSITDKLPGFPVVCLEIPEGCTSAGTPCPTSLDEVLTPPTTTTTTSTSTSTTTTSTTTLGPCGPNPGTCPEGESCCETSVGSGVYSCVAGACGEA